MPARSPQDDPEDAAPADIDAGPADRPARQPIEVTAQEAGQKLLQFLVRRFPGVPGSAMLRAIRTGQVRVDGGRRQPFHRLAQGQLVRVPPFHDGGADRAGTGPEQAPDADAPALPGLDILFEDAGLIAVNKPAGLCSHAGTRHRDSVADRLKALRAGASFSPTLAHRLDKDTSGILLVAKSYAELRRLGELFALGGERGGVAKTYLAWVDGAWPGRGPEILEDRLDRLELEDGKVAGRRKIVDALAAGPTGQGAGEGAGEGKLARCEVRPLLRKRAATLLAVRLFTGRTHQIRVQLSLRGHAVISDGVYGRKVRGVPMLLHALRLDLPELSLFAPPPWTGPFAVPEKVLAALRP